MMVDPQRLPHALGRAGAGEQGDGDREGAAGRSAAARSPPPPPSPPASAARARPRPRSARRSRPPTRGVKSSFSPAIGRSTSRDQWMLEPAQPVLLQIVPALPVEQAADLHDPHIVVGVAEREDADRAVAVPEHVAARRRARTAAAPSANAASNRSPAAPSPFPGFSSIRSGISRSSPKGKRPRQEAARGSWSEAARCTTLVRAVDPLRPGRRLHRPACMRSSTRRSRNSRSPRRRSRTSAAIWSRWSAGYVLHSRWSFRGHGTRDNAGRTTSRFFLVSLVSLALNALFIFILTDRSMLDGALVVAVDARSCS